MFKRRRTGLREINLTSLLDVLFCILFIVMVAGNQNEEDIKAASQLEIDQIQEELSRLDAQLLFYEHQMESYDIYHTQAVIITIANVVEKGGEHRLVISEGLNPVELDSVLMGTERIENIKQRLITAVINRIEETDNQPIYIIFYCDRKNIITDEYRAILEVLNKLQMENKEVFFKESLEEDSQ